MDSPLEQVRVVGICGSLRARSYTRMAVQLTLAGAEEAGAAIRLIDLREYELVFCAGSSRDVEYPPDVARLSAEVGAADGIILGTPEYHGSFSGVLKNALDLMGFREFEGKMVGLVGIAGGQIGALNALNGLRTIGRSLRAWVLPQQVSIARSHQAFAEDGTVKDTGTGQRLSDLGRMITRFAYLHTSDRARQFLAEWEQAQQNPGG